MIKNTCYNTVTNIRATLFFRVSASCSKIVNGEKIFNTVYIHLGAIRAIWASVVCNLDKSHNWLHGRNLVGDTGDVYPNFFRWGDIICHVPHFFLFRLCVWRGFKNKSKVCHILCKELFKLDGGLYIAKFMFKQSLVWYH